VAQVAPKDSARLVATTQALDDRSFIRHRVRGFWVFERDSAGAVNWRDNNAVVWRRVRSP
jgi:hypothetical protein